MSYTLSAEEYARRTWKARSALARFGELLPRLASQSLASNGKAQQIVGGDLPVQPATVGFKNAPPKKAGSRGEDREGTETSRLGPEGVRGGLMALGYQPTTGQNVDTYIA